MKIKLGSCISIPLVCLCTLYTTIFPEASGQKVKGIYLRDKDSFILDGSLGGSVIGKCMGGFCKIGVGTRVGVIDTAGNIFIGVDKASINIIQTPNNVYFLIRKQERGYGESYWSIFTKDTVSFFPAYPGCYIYLFSDTSGDYFYRQLVKEETGRYMTGCLFAVKDNKMRYVAREQKFKYDFRISLSVNKKENYFFKGMLISPGEGDNLVLRDFHLDTLYGQLKVKYVSASDTLQFVIENNPPSKYRYSLVYAANPSIPIESFDSFNAASLSLFFAKDGKAGSLMASELRVYSTDVDFKYLYLPPIFDSIRWYEPDHLGLLAYKQDTVFYYLLEQKRKPFIYNQDFEKAYLFARQDKFIPAGYKGKWYDEKIRPKVRARIVPNALYFGSSFAWREYIDKTTPDTFVTRNISLCAGFGWYKYRGVGLGVDKWKLYGLSLGIEYRMPYDHSAATIERLSGQPYNKLYYHANVEYAAALRSRILFVFRYGLHLKMTYSTDLKYHYLRPGLGFSANRLQFGIEPYAQLGPREHHLFHFGFYTRYVFVKNKNMPKRPNN